MIFTISKKIWAQEYLIYIEVATCPRKKKQTKKKQQKNLCILFIDYMFKLCTIQTFLILSEHLLLHKHLTTSTEFLFWGEHIIYLFIYGYLVNYDMFKFPSGIIFLNPEDNTDCNGSCHTSGIVVNSLTFCISEGKKKVFHLISYRYFCRV